MKLLLSGIFRSIWGFIYKGFLYSIIAIVNSDEMRSVCTKDEEASSCMCRCGSNVADTMRKMLYKVCMYCTKTCMFLICHSTYFQ